MTDGRRAWSWRQAFSKSDLPPTTKHVLHTLALFMNEMGESCYPSIDQLIEHSSLSKNAIMKHLEVARDAGWVSISQHGFKGQRWKRKDYVARWPERKLDAPSLTERIVNSAESEEEGGACGGPPPLEKVVHEVGEGGARGGPKVVHEVDQDKNNPINNPIPIHMRESARESENVKNDNKGKVSRETWVRRLKKLHASWSTGAGDSVEVAERLWFGLTAEERNQAAKLAKAYERHIREIGRTKICSLLTYLKEKRWELLPKGSGNEGGEVQVAKPYGKLWGAYRFSELLKPPLAPEHFPKPPSIIQGRLTAGGDIEKQEKLDRLSIYGWESVVVMHQNAERGKGGGTVPNELSSLADEFEVVKVGSEIWQAWKQLHQERGWPRFAPDHALPDWIWMPRLVGDEYETLLEAVTAALENFEAVHGQTTNTTTATQEAAE
ncbi:helix-turn-helix domain-containing protein [Pseudovibrio ascidiaceicola]|uniref:helix-turn-helix domain-containing protein n=1 Tax=Pseudovibrio ascidiaceicola TaxID=285279 RepID=UPI003D35EDF0